jgi:hypothetical protein
MEYQGILPVMWAAHRFSACVRARFRANPVTEQSKYPAQEGRPSLAQRFSAWEKWKK